MFENGSLKLRLDERYHQGDQRFIEDNTDRPGVSEQLSDTDLLAFLENLLPVTDWSTARLRPLPVNYTSRFWRLDTPERIFVIKEFFPDNEDNPLYPTLPDQEAEALNFLARYDLAPELETYSQSPAGTPLLVYGYAPPVNDEIDVGEAADLIGRIAALKEPVPGHQTVPAGYHEVLERGDAMPKVTKERLIPAASASGARRSTLSAEASTMGRTGSTHGLISVSNPARYASGSSSIRSVPWLIPSQPIRPGQLTGRWRIT